MSSVGRCLRVRSGCKSDSLVGSIKDGVEALKEGEPVDEIKTFSRVRSKVVYDEVDTV